MLKKIISVMFLVCVSFQSLADVAVNDLYTRLENKKYDKPYTDFIEPLAKIIGTTEPMSENLESVEYIMNVTGLQFFETFSTPIIEQERKIVSYGLKTDGYSSKASQNFVVSFFVVNHKVEKILLNVQSRYGDQYYRSKSGQEALDNRVYMKKKLVDLGWTFENPITSFFTANYVFTKGDIELVAGGSVFYPLEIDIKRKDLADARAKFDVLTELHSEMLTRSVEESRKKRFED